MWLRVLLGCVLVCVVCCQQPKSSLELQVPLTKLMAYDCQTDGHSIIVKETSLDGIPLTHGEVILDYVLPEGVVWKDLKFRTHMGSLYISVPIVHTNFYTIQSIDENGIII